MGVWVTLGCATPVLLCVLLYLLCQDRLLSVPGVQTVPHIWWGRGEGEREEEKITKFQVKSPSNTISDLHARIKSDLARLRPPLEDSRFEYGFNTEFLAEVARYWVEEYDWDEQLTLLNSFPQ